MTKNTQPFERPSMELLEPEFNVFEERRRKYETRNEIVISAILGVSGAAALAVHLPGLFLSEATSQSELLLLCLLGLGMATSVGTIVYLKRDPPYLRFRKHATTVFSVCIGFLAMLALQTDIPPKVASFVPVGMYVLLIVISGLRFDRGVVILAGAVAFASHLLYLFVVLPTGDYTLPSAINAFIIIAATCACMTYAVSNMLRLHRETVWRERLTRFFAPEVVKEISSKPEFIGRKMEKRIASVLFVDIRGFTTLSEECSSEEVGEILNVFLEEMTSSVMDNRGMVDKFMGDSVMGVFGVPVASEEHAVQAVRAAMDMKTRLRKVNAVLAEGGKPPLAIGVGIHTGEVLAGAIGSSRRLEYTVIGDTVNVASRLESLTKEHSEVILLSGDTRDATNDAIPLRRVASTPIRGRRQPVVLWSPA